MFVLNNNINVTSVHDNGYYMQITEDSKEVEVVNENAVISKKGPHTLKLINKNSQDCSAELKIGPHYSKRLILKGRSCRTISSGMPISPTSSIDGQIKCSFAPSLEEMLSLKFMVKSYLPGCQGVTFNVDDLTDISTVRELRASIVHYLRLSNHIVDTANFDILHTTFPTPRLQANQGIETVFSIKDDDKQLYEFGFFENEERKYRLCLIPSKSFQIIGIDDTLIYESSSIPSVSKLIEDLTPLCLYTKDGRLILNSKWEDLKTFSESLLFFLRVEELGTGSILRLYNKSEESCRNELIHVYVRTRSNICRLISCLDIAMPLCLITHKLRLRMSLNVEISSSRNRLIFNGVQLPKSGTIQESNIKPGNLLFLVPILCGVPDYHEIVTMIGSDSKFDKMSDDSFNYGNTTSLNLRISKGEFSDDDNLSFTKKNEDSSDFGDRPIAFT